MSRSKIILLVAIMAAIGAFFVVQPGQYLGGACEQGLFSLDCFSQQRAGLEAFQQDRPLLLAAGFFVVYVLVTALSIPGAAVMTLIGGALFGLLWGVLIISFASSIGATLAFLAARFVLRDTVQQRFGRRLRAINRGVEKDGAFYLFALRLVPAFPFFVINLLMGLTPIRTVTFYVVSQLGMLAGTIVYVNAGTQIGQLESLAGILSPGLIGSFVLLGVFPLIARKGLEYFQARKALRGYTRPRRFDRNLIVIGAGSGGLVAAYIAAAVKAKVTLIEKSKMGGDCLNTGCVPSKALIRSAKLVHQMRHSAAYGIRRADFEFDFADVMDRVHRVIAAIEPHDSMERYESLGVECIQASARLVDPWTVETDSGQRLSARAIILATGAEPLVPPIEGLGDVDYLTSDNLWDMRELPERLVVLGGGPIGCEMAQAFARLGSRVTQVEQGDRLMGKEDPDVSSFMLERFRQEGVDVRLGHRATAVSVSNARKLLICECAGKTVEIEFDRVLIALGRSARLEGFGLDTLGIEAGRSIEVNEFLQTRIPSIYACGDAIAPYQFTHAAAHEAWFAAVNGLFGSFKKFKVDYSTLPWCTFTDPEVAHVGLSEAEATEQGIDYEVTRYDMADLDRAIAESAAHGMVKVLTDAGKDSILGVTIVGEHAGDLLAEYVLAMKKGVGLNTLLGTIHSYPTLAEANKFAAGEWKRAHAPEKLLRYVEKFHAWRRG